MKKHAIIPIFIPHRGCRNACVFCNQRAITARDSDITPEGARQIIESYLPTLQNRELDEIEVSFFGGSFTGIPIEDQSAFLAVAKEYKDNGLINKIHLSTRPDYINKDVLDNLKYYGADVIELGVQSFDQRVLDASKRGHSVSCVYEACELIKSYGFTLGIQLMTGLPGDSYESCMYSVAETVKIMPQLARIYPTVVISGTELAEMYRAGKYEPFGQDLALKTVTDMYRALTDAGIYVMRIGLKSTALINEDSDYVLCGYHPAFRQLVEGEIAKAEIEEKLEKAVIGAKPELLSGRVHSSGLIPADAAVRLEMTASSAGSVFDPSKQTTVTITANSEDLNAASGHQGCNRKYFEEKYPQLRFRFVRDDSAQGIEVAALKKAYISKLAGKELVKYLRGEKYDVCFVSPCVSRVAKPIACHPDVYICDLSDELFFGDVSKLSEAYPGDVLYNAARVGKYFLCSKYTDPELCKKAEAKGLKPIYLKQGYVKCNSVVVDDTHVITEDKGIAEALAEQTDIKCLLISPKQVALPGYPYGFIGGASGRVGNEIVFNGNLSAHSDYEKIVSFVADCGLGIIYFESYPLTDIGSIITE